MNGRKRKRNGWIKWVVIALAAVIVIVFAWPRISTLIGGNSASGNSARSAGTAGATASGSAGSSAGSYSTVTKGNLEVTVYGSGSLSPQKRYTLYNDSNGKVESVEVDAGDTVKEGDVLVRLSSSEIETNIKTYEKELFNAQVSLSAVRDTGSVYYVYAPSAGTVKMMVTEENDDVATLMKQYGYLCVISRDDKMRIEFEPENGQEFATGDVVSVWYNNLELVGTVEQVVGLGGNIAVTIVDDSYEVGSKVLITTQQGERLGEGVMEINMPVPITGIGGVVDTIYYEENESVASGAKLFYLTGRLPSSDLQAALLTYDEAKTALDNEKEKEDNLIIRAPIDGVVTSVDVSKGTNLDESVGMVTLQSNTLYNVVASVDELDVVNVKVGQTVKVEIDAYPDESFSGTVTRISGVGTVSGGVASYEVTVAMDADARLMDGMTASIEIVVASKSDALLVPVEAISTSNGQKYVTTSTGLSTTVTTGLSDDENVEILTGVSEGDQVLITRSSSTSSGSSAGGFPGGGMGGGMPSGMGGGMGGGMPGGGGPGM